MSLPRRREQGGVPGGGEHVEAELMTLVGAQRLARVSVGEVGVRTVGEGGHLAAQDREGVDDGTGPRLAQAPPGRGDVEVTALQLVVVRERDLGLGAAGLPLQHRSHRQADVGLVHLELGAEGGTGLTLRAGHEEGSAGQAVLGGPSSGVGG